MRYAECERLLIFLSVILSLSPQALWALPPLAPGVSGPSSGSVGETLSYTLTSTDPEGDMIRYGASWGDGTTTDPMTQPLVPSGQSVTLSHVYNSAGTFEAHFFAMDAAGAASPSTIRNISIGESAPPPPPPPATDFTKERVDDAGTGLGEFTALAIDKSGNLHVAYRAAGTSSLKYVKRTGTIWGAPETVDASGNVGRRVSIAVDINGEPRLSYYDDTNQDLKYAKKSGASWDIATVDSAGDVGLFTSLAIDGSGNPHIAYKDQTNQDVKYARFDGASWSAETVDSAGDLGEYLSLALDGVGNPNISYYDMGSQDLKYAKKSGASWDIATVDSAGDVGNYSSIILDASGRPRISYIDRTNSSLKYARFNGVSWDLSVVDSGDLKDVTSIALDGAGNPHISYNKVIEMPADWDLKYARWTGTSWSVQTVESAGNAGDYAHIALDGSGDVHISFLDTTNTDLKLAHWTGAGHPAPMGGNARGKVQAPSGFQAASVGATSINWSWIDNSSNESGFRLFGAATSTGPFTLIADTNQIGSNSVSFTETGLTPGVAYFRYITAVNDGGVVASAGVSAQTTDTEPPDTQITSRPPNPDNNRNPSFSFAELGSDPSQPVIFQCKVDMAAFASCVSPHTIASPLADGSHTFEVRAKDNAGNIDATPAVYTWTVDTQAPAAGPVTAANTATTVHVDNPFDLSTSFTDSSAIAGCEYTKDNLNWLAANFSGGVCSASPTCTDGQSLTLNMRATDNAGSGNTGSGSAVTRTCDAAPPTGSVVINNNDTYVNRLDVNLGLTQGDGAGSGVNQVRYSNDGVFDVEPWEAPASSKAWTLVVGDGLKTVFYKIKDHVDNLSIGLSDAITLDQTPPVTTDNVPAGWSGADVTVTLTPTDPTSGVNSTFNCSDSVNACVPATPGVSIPVSCQAGSVCETYVRYFSKDNAANEESVKSSLVRIDKQAPSGGSIAYPNESVSSPIGIAYFNGNDGSGSGLGTRVIQRSSAPLVDGQCGVFGDWTDAFTNPTSCQTSEPVSPGCYKYRYVVNDQAGNQKIYSSANIAQVR